MHSKLLLLFNGFHFTKEEYDVLSNIVKSKIIQLL